MKNIKIHLLILILSVSIISNVSFAQSQTSTDYTKVIGKIDSLIGTTYRIMKLEVDRSKKLETPPSSSIIALNKINCEELKSNLIPNLEKELLVKFGGDENVNNQIYPFIVSLKECTEALENLTRSQFYDKDNFNDYTNAFLFKELAKGNLFRSLSNISSDRKHFTVSLSFGVLFNNVESQIQDNLYPEWQGVNSNTPDLYNENQGLSKAYFLLALDYNVSEKVVLEIGIHNIPVSGSSGKFDTNDSIVSGNNGDYYLVNSSYSAQELIHGTTVHLNAFYKIKKIKPNGYGFEINCGGGFVYNNYKVDENFKLVERRKTYNPFDTAFINTISESDFNTQANLHSLGINLKATCNYHFNKNISLQLGIAKYFDFGVNVPGQTFYDTTIKEHTLNVSPFAIDLGLAAHF